MKATLALTPLHDVIAKTRNLRIGAGLIVFAATCLSACHPIQTVLSVKNQEARAFAIDVDRGYIRETIPPNHQELFPIDRGHIVRRIVATSVDDPATTITYEFPSGIAHVLFDITISQ